MTNSDPKNYDMGEMIHFWISRKGHLNLSTSEEEIIAFYKEHDMDCPQYVTTNV